MFVSVGRNRIELDPDPEHCCIMPAILIWLEFSSIRSLFILIFGGLLLLAVDSWLIEMTCWLGCGWLVGCKDKRKRWKKEGIDGNVATA